MSEVKVDLTEDVKEWLRSTAVAPSVSNQYNQARNWYIDAKNVDMSSGYWPAPQPIPPGQSINITQGTIYPSQATYDNKTLLIQDEALREKYQEYYKQAQAEAVRQILETSSAIQGPTRWQDVTKAAERWGQISYNDVFPDVPPAMVQQPNELVDADLNSPSYLASIEAEALEVSRTYAEQVKAGTMTIVAIWRLGIYPAVERILAEFSLAKVYSPLVGCLIAERVNFESALTTMTLAKAKEKPKGGRKFDL